VADYVPDGMNGGVNIVPPAIDPLAPKNMALSVDDATFVVSHFGIDVTRPMICQVSRFDPWKDPLGVIDAYRIVKSSDPTSSSRSWAPWRPTTRRAGTSTTRPSRTRPTIPTSTSSTTSTTSGIEVNAFQSLAEVLVQKSTREGFGLTVSEALWKGRPFIGGDVGGIPLQISDGVSGTSSLRGGVRARALQILEDPEMGRELGRRGKQHVREHFLTPRYLRDYLRSSPSGGHRMSASDASAPLVLVSNRGPGHLPGGRVDEARHGWPGHRLDRPRVAPRGDVDRQRHDGPRRRSRGGERRRPFTSRRPEGGEFSIRLVNPTRTPTTASTTSSPTRCSGSSSTTCGT
jgi:hypothetical protein